MRTIAGTTWPVEMAREYIKARVEVDANGCWIWQRGAVYDPTGFGGYGRFRVPLRHGGTQLLAHRVSFDAFVEPPAGLVLHKCDVPACCNPEHLYVGSCFENAHDRCVRGRASKKLTPATVVAIRNEVAGGSTQAAVGRRYGVGQDVVSRIVSGAIWRHVG